MTESEIRGLIREEIQRSMGLLLYALTGEGGLNDTDISALYPGGKVIEDLPTVYPFGIHSNVPRETVALIGRIGEHVGNRIVMGHRDAQRPNIELEEGETVIYSRGGRRIVVRNEEIFIGTEGAEEPLVLGAALSSLLSTVLDALSSHVHTNGNMGGPTGTPTNASVYSSAKSEVDSGNIVSDSNFTEK